MGTMLLDLTMSLNACVTQVLKWAYDQFGLALRSHQTKALEKNLKDYLAKTELTPESLLTTLKQKSTDTEVPQDVIDLLTVQESYFFRDASLFQLLRREFLPELIQKRRAEGKLKLSIWSAGCSRGEEICSVAILLHELLSDISNWDINLVGTDINLFAIEKAKAGAYSSTSLRAVDDVEKINYFTKEGNTYYLNGKTKEMVRYAYGNIVDEKSAIGQFDIVLCRNVFIYLDEKSVVRALKRFKEVLVQDGKILLGTSDFVRYYQQEFYLNTKLGVMYLTHTPPEAYQKKAKAEAKESKPVSFFRAQQIRVQALKDIQSLLAQKEYAKALHQIYALKEGRLIIFESVLYQYKGEALLGLGDVATAKEVLEEGIRQDKDNAKLYFLLALASMGEDIKVTEQALKQAIELKDAFPEAHYHLAMLYLSCQQTELGLTHLKTAKAFAEADDAESSVLGSDGSMGELVCAIEKEIAYYEGLRDEV